MGFSPCGFFVILRGTPLLDFACPCVSRYKSGRRLGKNGRDGKKEQERSEESLFAHSGITIFRKPYPKALPESLTKR